MTCRLLLCIVLNTTIGVAQSVDTAIIQIRKYSVEHTWANDSLRLYPYHSTADLVGRVSGFSHAHLGNVLQPGWLGTLGSFPEQSAINVNGNSVNDPVTGLANSFYVLSEDMASMSISPLHTSYWYGGNGKLLSVDFTEAEANAPTPFTRIRHTEAPYDYLYTDVIFSLNPGSRDNIYAAVNRQSLGVSTNRFARYQNEQAESWDIRLKYRYDLTDALRLKLKNSYHDHIRFHHGGIQGLSDGTFMLYPDRSATYFTDSAFSPILATLVNPTMRTRETQNATTFDAVYSWPDSIQSTALTLIYRSTDRSYDDELHEGQPDSLSVEKASTFSEWSDVSALLSHRLTTAIFQLTADGLFGRQKFSTSVLDEESDVRIQLRSALALFVHPVELVFRARYEHQYGRSGFGGSVTASVQLGDSWMFWTGFSGSQRIPSLIERKVLFQRTVNENSLRDAPDKLRIAEAGLTFASSFSRTDLRFHYWDLERTQTLQTGFIGPIGNTAFHRFTTIVTPFDDRIDTKGLSLNQSFEALGFHSESSLTYFTQHRTKSDQSTDILALTPSLSLATSLFYRGYLIAGTLDIKVGGSLHYNDEFNPTIFNPETGWFGYAQSDANGATDFTRQRRLDVFLVATVKETATIHFEIFNLLDERTISTQFYPMFERSFRFGVDWILWE